MIRPLRSCDATPFGRWRLLLAAGLPFIIAAFPLAAQDSVVVAAIAEHRYPVLLEDGELIGSGGVFLLNEGREARYTLIGEEHGIAEIPSFAAAWFRGLVPAGYRHLAVEVGPTTGRLLDSLASLGSQALHRFQEEHSPGFPFFILKSESSLLVEARRALPDAEHVIWGIDYDILGDRYLFDALERAAPDESGLDVVREVRAQGDEGLKEVVRTGNPGGLLLWSAPDEPFERLRAAVRPAPGSRADEIIETMQETAAINRLFLTGENWQSNHRRVGMMKRWFARHDAAARRAGEERPRVMTKLGANHLFRGLNRTRQYDIGAMLAQLAEAEGGRSFHLLVAGGPGTEHAVFNPVRLSYEPQAVSLLAADLPFHDLLLPDGWTVFDLRPLRRLIHDRRLDVPASLFELVFNFDALLVLSGSTPAEPWFDPGEVLRRR